MKYKIWYADDFGNEGEYDTLEFRPYPMDAFDTYREAFDRAFDWQDAERQLWSVGIDVDEYGQPTSVTYYQIRDENGNIVEETEYYGNELAK